MKVSKLALLLLLLLPVYALSLTRTAEERKRLPSGEMDSYVLPAPVLKIASLEFDGVTADFLFLRSLVFLGSTLERKEQPGVKDGEWRWLNGVWEAATGLDPHFLDPYYLANAHLTWDAGMVEEANVLLDKGARARSWEAFLPFCIGFNSFYFLQQNDRASESLMEAARRPDAQPVYADLAAKLAFKEKATENAITFLQEMIRRTEDPSQKEAFEMRLIAYQNIYALENAVARFKERFKRRPADMHSLVAAGIIPSVPKDPYGGTYSIDRQGQIKTTSYEWLLPYQRRSTNEERP